MSVRPLERQRGAARRLLIASAWLALLIVAGCDRDGDGDVGDATATDIELLARASAAIHDRPRQIIGRPGERGAADAIAYADLAAAREQLGLPGEAGIPGRGKRRLLSSFAARPLFHFAPGLWWYGRPRHPELKAEGPRSLGPLGEVLDTGAIEVAIGTSFAFSGPGASEVDPGDVLVLRTRQPFDEIGDRLRRGEGYEETADGLLVGGERFDPNGIRIASHYDGVAFRAVGDAGRGVVVFGGSPRAARAALAGEGTELTPAAGLVVELPGVSRVAAGEALLGFGCVVAFGLGEDATPREGGLLAVVEGEAWAEHLRLGGLTAVGIADDTEVTFAKATAKGERVVAPFTSTDHLNATRLAVEEAEDPYYCPVDGPGGVSRPLPPLRDGDAQGSRTAAGSPTVHRP